jgi:hypothetical protein
MLSSISNTGSVWEGCPGVVLPIISIYRHGPALDRRGEQVLTENSHCFGLLIGSSVVSMSLRLAEVMPFMNSSIVVAVVLGPWNHTVSSVVAGYCI